MTKRANKQLCGDCEHAIKMTDPNNIGSDSLHCCVNPPTALLIVKGNNATILNVRPQVMKETPCCVQFSPKAMTLV